MKRISIWICLILGGMTLGNSPATSQSLPDLWNELDSLQRQGLPQSAREVAGRIRVQAEGQGQPFEAMKAELWGMALDMSRGEDPLAYAIAYAESRIDSTPLAQRSIWQSLTAELYWNHYQQHRWKVHSRSPGSSGIGTGDLAYFAPSSYGEKILSLYMASVAPMEEISRLSISSLGPLVLPGKNREGTRPYLFDLLAHRFLDYLGHGDAAMLSPSDPGGNLDPRWYYPLDSFMGTEADSPVHLLQMAYHIYQQLYRLHRSHPTALMDLDMKRWAWVYQKEPSPESRNAYIQALDYWAGRYPDHPLGGMAAFRRLQLEWESSSLEGEPDRADTLNLERLIKEWEGLVVRFPREEAGIMARNQINRLKERKLELRVPEAGIPGENQPMFLGYRNLEGLQIRIFKGEAESLWEIPRKGTEEAIRWASQSEPWREWSLDLPGPADYRSHSTEWVMEGLAAGSYLVWVQSRDDSLANRLHAFAFMQQSGLALMESRDGEFQVLDRVSGYPVPGVRVQAYQILYGNQEQRSPLSPRPSLTGEDGRFSLKGMDRGRIWIRLEKGEDRLIHSTSLSPLPSGEQKAPQRRSFFYTDRGVYKPGQQVDFKAIVLDQDMQGADHRLVTDFPFRIYLVDAQGQRIDSLERETNAWGSVSGSFRLPMGRLNGNYRLVSPWGQQSFSVESYQRPGFFLRFDTLKQNLALGDTVIIEGESLAYSGQPLAGREGKFRVLRRTYWPYVSPAARGGYFPRPMEPREYARGSFRTDSRGKFSFSFVALPESRLDSLLNPVYTFEVEAEITDIGGETQRGETRVPLGFHSLILSLDVPAETSREALSPLPLRMTNLWGVNQSLPFRIRIYSLEAPKGFVRPRLWLPPDRPLLDSITFKRKLPLDAYGLESEMAHWPRGEKIWDQRFNAYPAQGLDIPPSVWKGYGGYEIVLEARDPQTGALLDVSRRVEVWDPEMSPGRPMALKLQIPRKLNPGDSLQVFIHSDLPGARIREERFWPSGKRTSRDWIMDGSPKHYAEKIEEEDGGGLGFQYTLVYRNRVYRFDHHLQVDFPGKELKAEWVQTDSLLSPGDSVTWTLRIVEPRSAAAEAEWLLVLYDQSLDALRPHGWALPPLYRPRYYPPIWSGLGFSHHQSHGWDPLPREYRGFDVEYPRLIQPWGWGGMGRAALAFASSPNPVSMETSMMNRAGESDKSGSVAREEDELPMQKEGENSEPQAQFPLRSDFRETAFFLPQARTLANGDLAWDFQIPEALTRWKFMGIAHTRDLRWTQIESRVITQKKLMVQTGIPRFLMQGDQIRLESRISNLGCGSGPARISLDLEDPQTGQNLNKAFGLKENSREISLDSGVSMAQAWGIQVPESRYAPVRIRIKAERGFCRDGEEHILPLLSQRIWVTETLPLWFSGDGEKEYFWTSLHEKNQHPQRVDIRLTAEYYAHPLWLVLPSLPYLAEPRFASAESIFGKIYSGGMIEEIFRANPDLKSRIPEAADEGKGSPSPWEKARDLAGIPLEQTPWIQDSESEKRAWEWLRGILGSDSLDLMMERAGQQLLDRQGPHGGIPWFAGMPADRFITQYILSGMGRLEAMRSQPLPAACRTLVENGLSFADAFLVREFKEMKSQYPDRMKDPHLGTLEVQYLYMRSFFSAPMDSETREAWWYYLGQAETYWKQFPAQAQAMLSLALYRAGKKVIAESILASLLENSLYDEEFGRYWKRPQNPYSWVQAPLSTQVRIMEAMQEIRRGDPSIPQMALWLIKQKQSRHWPSAMATIDACHVLISLSTTGDLSREAGMEWQMGDRHIRTSDGESSLGYWRMDIPGSELDSGMARIRLRLDGSSSLSSWGALYWQYTDQRDKGEESASGLRLRREVLVERPGPGGSAWESLGEGDSLIVGDRVRVVLFLESDRDMDYVHLEDAFASAWSPESVISGYRGSDGLGFYQTGEEAAMHFFFSRMPKGKFQVHYDLQVRQAGEVDAGLATMNSLYAPSFRAQSKGRRISIKPL